MKKLTTELIYEIINTSDLSNVIYIAGEYEIVHFRDLYMKNGRFDLLNKAVWRIQELEISQIGISTAPYRVFLVNQNKDIEEISLTKLENLFSNNERHPYI